MVRFAAHFGSLSNISTLKSMGFTEAGIVIPYGGNPSPAAIHNAGIPTATLNIFNDGSADASQPGAAGGQYAGYFQSIVSNGWNCIGGEGVGGSVVGTVMNYCPYVNYGGIVGDSQGNMYASPWNHPASGGHGHWDYIETYNNSNQYRDPSEAISWSRSAGAGHLGILIMFGPSPAADASTYINLVKSLGLDTVLFWAGYDSDSSVCTGLAQQMITALGATASGAPATSGGKAAAAAVAKKPVIKCPCRHLQIGFRGVTGNSTSQHVEFKVQLIGSAGWVDDNEKWIMNKPYTGKLQLWCRNAANKSWKMMDFFPDKNGKFAIYIGSDTAEKRAYNVCFADKGSSPAYQVVMQ